MTVQNSRTANSQVGSPDRPSRLLEIVDRFAERRLAVVGDILADDSALEAFVKKNAFGCWHASGTCRMGRRGDPAAVVFDSVAAVNPLLVVPSITKIPGSYLLTVALLAGVLAAKWSGDYFLPRVIPIPIVPSIISTCSGLYLLMVEARVLGLLYLVNKERLAWFGHR